MIPMFYPFIPKDDILKELDDTLSTRWIGEGPKVKMFEKVFGEFIGNENTVAVNSGTSALDLAYECCGLGEGDEVITPVLTCTATNHPLLRRKCNIIFSDINKDTLNPSLSDIVRKVTYKTKAVVIIHNGGFPFDVRRLRKLIPMSVPIIEDACQALGSYYSRRMQHHIGCLSGLNIYTCFSFQAIKLITTGDGGMLICPDKKTTDKAKRLRWFGIDRDRKKQNNWHPVKDRQITFDVVENGFKYQMTDIAASFGLAQMKHIDEAISHRRNIAMIYNDQVKNPLVNIVKENFGSAYWIYPVIVDNACDFITHMESNGIESNIVQVRNDAYSIFGNKRELENMDRLEHKYAYIPIHCNIDTELAKHIARVVNGYKN